MLQPFGQSSGDPIGAVPSAEFGCGAFEALGPDQWL